MTSSPSLITQFSSSIYSSSVQKAFQRCVSPVAVKRSLPTAPTTPAVSRRPGRATGEVLKQHTKRKRKTNTLLPLDFFFQRRRKRRQQTARLRQNKKAPKAAALRPHCLGPTSSQPFNSIQTWKTAWCEEPRRGEGRQRLLARALSAQLNCCPPPPRGGHPAQREPSERRACRGGEQSEDPLL